jgi:hypothetical protein
MVNWFVMNIPVQEILHLTSSMGFMGSMGGIAVRALVSHHCGLDLIPGLSVICELSCC